ncbi:MAG TPA: hypothetical protein VNH22_03855 [Blastocatellia bacterium]|jgi:hypothetical protein|nr:hypothetical protein [Blastocatellia bacterium]
MATKKSASTLIGKIRALGGCVYYKGEEFDPENFAAGMANWDEDTIDHLSGQLDYILGTAILYKEAMENPLIKPKPRFPYASVQIGLDGSLKSTWSKTKC